MVALKYATCILVSFSFFWLDLAQSQSKDGLICSIEELTVANVRNQTKMESLQKDDENFKVCITVAEAEVETRVICGCI